MKHHFWFWKFAIWK